MEVENKKFVNIIVFVLDSTELPISPNIYPRSGSICGDSNFSFIISSLMGTPSVAMNMFLSQ